MNTTLSCEGKVNLDGHGSIIGVVAVTADVRLSFRHFEHTVQVRPTTRIIPQSLRFVHMYQKIFFYTQTRTTQNNQTDNEEYNQEKYNQEYINQETDERHKSSPASGPMHADEQV